MTFDREGGLSREIPLQVEQNLADSPEEQAFFDRSEDEKYLALEKRWHGDRTLDIEGASNHDRVNFLENKLVQMRTKLDEMHDGRDKKAVEAEYHELQEMYDLYGDPGGEEIELDKETPVTPEIAAEPTVEQAPVRISDRFSKEEKTWFEAGKDDVRLSLQQAWEVDQSLDKVEDADPEDKLAFVMEEIQKLKANIKASTIAKGGAPNMRKLDDLNQRLDILQTLEQQFETEIEDGGPDGDGGEPVSIDELPAIKAA